MAVAQIRIGGSTLTIWWFWFIQSAMRKVLIKSDGWLRQKTSGTQKVHSHFKYKSFRYELNTI